MPETRFNPLAIPTGAFSDRITDNPGRAGALGTRLPPLIEIGEKAAPAVILRDGLEIKAPAVNPAKVGSIIEKLKPVDKFQVPRVVAQSAPPGTRVTKGTAVDLTLVAPSFLDLGVFDGIHEDLRTRAITDVAVALTPKVRQILANHEDVTTLPEADRQEVVAALQPLQLQIDPDESSQRSLGKVLVALKGAQAFL